MRDLRKAWNVGSLSFGFLFPILLGAFESTMRGLAGDADTTFFPPALAAAGLAALLPCLPIGPRPPDAVAGEPVDAAVKRRDYNWNATVLILAVVWFLVGSLTWVVILGNTIKGAYPWWWPEFELPAIHLGQKVFPKISVAGTESLVFYVLAVVLAIAKLRKQ